VGGFLEREAGNNKGVMGMRDYLNSNKSYELERGAGSRFEKDRNRIDAGGLGSGSYREKFFGDIEPIQMVGGGGGGLTDRNWAPVGFSDRRKFSPAMRENEVGLGRPGGGFQETGFIVNNKNDVQKGRLKNVELDIKFSQ
jgi:hypothetical protein